MTARDLLLFRPRPLHGTTPVDAGCLLPRLVLRSVAAPREAFALLAGAGSGAGLVLMLLRWAISPFTTVANLLAHPGPMLLPPPLPLPPEQYRQYELYWYGPYGFLVVVAIAWVLFRMLRTRRPGDWRVTFPRVLGLTSLAFFTPWLVSLPVETVSIANGFGGAAFLVPFHLAVLAWECSLVVIGAEVVYSMDRRGALALGATAAGMFLVLGGLVIR